MTFSTPVLTDRVPYTWDELKSRAIDPNAQHRFAHAQVPQPRAETMTHAMNQGAALKPLGEANVRVATVKPAVELPRAQSTVIAPVQSSVNDQLVGEIVDAVVPLIMERLHAQVSIMVDMTMKQAASKIRNDFDNALKMTVQSAVQKVVEEKLTK